MIDLHVHSIFSPDSRTLLKDIINVAKYMGRIAVTDHYDIEHNGKEFKIENLDSYLKALKKAKIISNRRILIGIEIGMVPKIVPKNIPFNKLDYIIGSIHSVPGIIDPAMEDPNFVIKQFLQTTYEAILNNDYFHSLGHLDYILRYISIKSIKKYKSDVIDILGLLIKKDKLLEINTSGYYHGLKRQHPEDWVIEAFYEMGGKLTIGSDAHSPEMIGYKIDDTIKKLKSMNCKYIYYCEKGKVKCLAI